MDSHKDMLPMHMGNSLMVDNKSMVNQLNPMFNQVDNLLMLTDYLSLFKCIWMNFLLNFNLLIKIFKLNNAMVYWYFSTDAQ